MKIDLDRQVSLFDRSINHSTLIDESKQNCILVSIDVEQTSGRSVRKSRQSTDFSTKTALSYVLELQIADQVTGRISTARLDGSRLQGVLRAGWSIDFSFLNPNLGCHLIKSVKL